MTGDQRSWVGLAPALAWVLLMAPMSAGCSVIVGGQVDDLTRDINAKRDVFVELRDFDPHIGQLTDIRFIRLDEDTMTARQVSARILINPTPSGCMDMALTRGAPFAADQVDFYADLNMNGMLDPPGETGDHVWREPILDDDRMQFIHDTDFVDITADTGNLVLNSLQVNITGADPLEGASVVTLLVDEDLVDIDENLFERSVPAMHVTNVTGGAIAFTFGGVVDPGETYDLEFIVGDYAQRCVIANLEAPSAAGSPLVIERDFSSLDCQSTSMPPCTMFHDACFDDGDQEACRSLAVECPFVDCGR